METAPVAAWYSLTRGMGHRRRVVPYESLKGKDDMANNLKRDKQEGDILALAEGNSVRSTGRMTGIHRDTILWVMCRVGERCSALSDNLLRDLHCKRLQADEVWTFVGVKQRHLTEDDDESRVGDMWTFVALDESTKLVPCHLVGKRDRATADAFGNQTPRRGGCEPIAYSRSSD